MVIIICLQNTENINVSLKTSYISVLFTGLQFFTCVEVLA